MHQPTAGCAAQPQSAARRSTAECHYLRLAVRRSWRIGPPSAGVAGALRRRGSAASEGAQGSPIRSVEPSRARCREPKSLTWSLAACHAPPSFLRTPKSLFYKAQSRNHRRAYPKRSCRLRLLGMRRVPLEGTDPPQILLFGQFADFDEANANSKCSLYLLSTVFATRSR